jgi:hypothetical protein
MKYLKSLEEFKMPNNWYKEGEPRLHDYVILKINWYSPENNNYLNTHIGQISKIKKDTKHFDAIQYQIFFEKLPLDNSFLKKLLQHNKLSYVYKAQIYKSSPSKDELESILQSNKYNI